MEILRFNRSVIMIIPKPGKYFNDTFSKLHTAINLRSAFEVAARHFARADLAVAADLPQFAKAKSLEIRYRSSRGTMDVTILDSCNVVTRFDIRDGTWKESPSREIDKCFLSSVSLSVGVEAGRLSNRFPFFFSPLLHLLSRCLLAVALKSHSPKRKICSFVPANEKSMRRYGV